MVTKSSTCIYCKKRIEYHTDHRTYGWWVHSHNGARICISNATPNLNATAEEQKDIRITVANTPSERAASIKKV